MNDSVLISVLVLLIVVTILLIVIAAVNVGNLVIEVLALRKGPKVIVIDRENEIDWENKNEGVHL